MAFVARPDHLSSIPRTHVVEENQLPLVTPDLHLLALACEPTHTNKQLKNEKCKRSLSRNSLKTLSSQVEFGD